MYLAKNDHTHDTLIIRQFIKCLSLRFSFFEDLPYKARWCAVDRRKKKKKKKRGGDKINLKKIENKKKKKKKKKKEKRW
jgi:hypothetical protein